MFLVVQKSIELTFACSPADGPPALLDFSYAQTRSLRVRHVELFSRACDAAELRAVFLFA
jgi:hypothetical protein